jgi:hypothetical protein
VRRWRRIFVNQVAFFRLLSARFAMTQSLAEYPLTFLFFPRTMAFIVKLSCIFAYQYEVSKFEEGAALREASCFYGLV